MRTSNFVMFIAGALLAGGTAAAQVAADAPVVMQMKVNGVDLAYVEQGSGATVLFVHGASGDWRNWEGLRPSVSQQFRFVSLSRRYHYPNAWTDDGINYTFDQHVEDIAAFIRAMNVGRVHLVGNSYGGRLVGYVALKYPELLRSVVLGEPSLAVPTSVEGKAATAAYGRDITQSSALAKAGDDRQAAIALANAVLADAEGFSKWSPARQKGWLDNAHTMKPMYLGRPPAPVSCEQLKALQVPALVVRGERTRDGFKYGHEALLECLPSTAKGAVIPGATHQWPVDSPNDAAAIVVSFIAKY